MRAKRLPSGFGGNEMLSQHKNSWLQLAAIALLTGFMAACTSGGDIGSGGNQVANDDPDAPVDPDNPDAPPAATVASVTLIASSTTLRSDADQTDEGVTLTALLRDADNNAITGQVVSFSVDSGLLAPANPVTNETGQAQVTLTTPGDASNRAINVTASAGGQSDSLIIAVSGTNISVIGPASIGSGDVANFSATLVNAGGEGIGSETVTIASANGNSLSSATVDTDSNGNVAFTVTGDVGGADTISVAALGESASQSVTVSEFDLAIDSPMAATEVALGAAQTVTVTVRQNGAPSSGQTVNFSTTRGTATPATATTDGAGQATTSVSSSGAGGAGPATVLASTTGGASETLAIEFVATDPESVDVQASPNSIAVNGNSQIRAVVRDGVSNLVKNQVIDFSLVDNTAGRLSAPSASTDSRGLAVVTYTAGSVSSGTDDVSVTATVRDENPVVSNFTTLTVGGQALRVSIGTNNEITEVDSDGDGVAAEYSKEFAIIVTDPSGNPPPSDTVLSTRITPTRYRTGSYVLTDTSNPPDGAPDVWDFSPNTTLCASEDVDLDGVLDAGEDINGSNTLEPDAAARVEGPAPMINENGVAEVDVVYPQSHNGWTEVQLTVTATVSGTESSDSVTFFLEGLALDFINTSASPPGQTSPYGANPDGCNPG